jgi:hypothetical protein
LTRPPRGFHAIVLLAQRVGADDAREVRVVGGARERAEGHSVKFG